MENRINTLERAAEYYAQALFIYLFLLVQIVINAESVYCTV